MKFQLMTISALVCSVIGAEGEVTGSATAAPSAAMQTPAATPGTLPIPTSPSGQSQQQGLAPNSIPNPAAPAPSSGANAIQDSAVTPADQALLGQLQQSVVSRVPGSASWAPLHFQVQNGIVTVLGAVPNTLQQRQLEAVVQQTPGVLAVINKTTAAGSQPNGVGTSQDQALLLRVRQAVVPQIQVANTPVPVDFRAHQGVITIVGAVPSIAQKRQIYALVQQVPGVLQIRDQMTVAGAAGAAGSAQPLNPTASNSAGSNLGTAGITTQETIQNAGAINPSLTPTGRTNRTRLAPPLVNRSDLPPGLNRRVELPAALAPRTNSFQ